MLNTVLALGTAYGLGSISFSWLMVRLSTGADLRRQGSGNLGARNTLRVMGVIPALAVLAGDVGKGWLALYLSAVIAPEANLLLPAALFVILGHNFPLWLGFRGGKGLAAALGVFLYLSPLLMGCMVLTAALGLLITRRINPSAIIAVSAAPLLFHFTLADHRAWLWGLAMATPILYRHRRDFPDLLQALKGKKK